MRRLRPPAVFAVILAGLLVIPAACGGGGGDSGGRKGPKPEITLVAPVAGSLNGGSLVAVLTRGFADDFTQTQPQVTFDGAQATIDQIVNPEELWVLVPAGTGIGLVDVTVISTGKPQTATCGACFEYVPPPPDPTVTGVVPGQGDVAGGDRVIITGTDFEPSATVFFGKDPLWAQSSRVIYLDTRTLEVETPPEPAGQPGTVDVRVDLPGRFPAIFPGGFRYVFTSCSVASVTPPTGTTLGGETVTILGSGFDPSALVDFGGVMATNATWISSSEIQVASPPRATPDTVDVTVSSPTAVCSLPGAYSYSLPMGLCALDSVSPGGGSLGGGDTVTITGADFEVSPDPDPIVEFGSGGVWAASPTVTNPDDGVTLMAVTPPWGQAEKVDVRVTNQTSGLSCTLVGAFEYLGPGICVLTSVTPSTGSPIGGDVVRIVGAGLDPNPVQILFGSTEADLGTFFWIDANTVDIETPPVPSEGLFDVTYVNPGPSACFLPGGFEYRFPPTSCTITAVIPPMGPRTGGTWVTITGTNFPPDVRVFFDGTQANPNLTRVIDPSTIETVTPGTLRVRCVDVLVVGLSSGASCSLTDGYCYTSGCTLADVTPANGSMAGGEIVTITGSDFDPGGSVRFGTNFAPWTNFIDSTRIEAMTPPSAVSGPVEVKIFGSAAVQCSLIDGYTYDAGTGGACTVSAVLPAQGPAQGGGIVDVIGSGFEGAPVPPGVLFGFNPSPNVIWVSDAQLQVEVPNALFAGGVDVTVVNDSGSTCTLSQGYIYDPLPTCNTSCTIDSVLPDGGPPLGGNPVQIAGTGFCDGSRVWFGPTRVGGSVRSDTEIIVFAPPSASLGWVSIAVEGPNGVICFKADAYEYR